MVINRPLHKDNTNFYIAELKTPLHYHGRRAMQLEIHFPADPTKKKRIKELGRQEPSQQDITVENQQLNNQSKIEINLTQKKKKKIITLQAENSKDILQLSVTVTTKNIRRQIEHVDNPHDQS